MNIPALMLSDGYKYGHHLQYPENTSLVYTNWTPRSNSHAPAGCDRIVSIGQQLFVRWLKDTFEDQFFKLREDQAIDYIQEELSLYLGTTYNVDHFRKLHKLGYLPLHIKSLPEGTLVPMKIPMLTMYNTGGDDFYWLPNFLETIMSDMLWQAPTSATVALLYRRILEKAAMETNSDMLWFVDWQAHDFSMRGLSGDTATVLSGIGHATVFSGSDTVPAIWGARKYYDAKGQVIGSVNATEHSVMCAGGKEDEFETFKRLITEVHPTGIVSIVSDTWDLWKVLTDYLPRLKEIILARDGKVVIRPDSGDPVDILCGTVHGEDLELFEEGTAVTPQGKGVIELLWDTFGGTITKEGYKQLDPHIGAIYGDSITPERAQAIVDRLKAKSFASTNVVLGIGSYTYQYKTRDTFGFAMKATYVEVKEKCNNSIHDPYIISSTFPCEECEGTLNSIVGRPIFKDPITDSGVKKSAKGLLQVYKVDGAHGSSNYLLKDECTWAEESIGELRTIFLDGRLFNQVDFATIRERLRNAR